MSVGSVLKKIGKGAADVGQGIGREILGPNVLDIAPQQQSQAPAMQQAPAAAQPTPFKLPELDPNDPDIEEKMAIHKAYEQLAERLTGSAAEDNIDLGPKYEELAKYAASRPQPKKWSPFSSFAIAMGSPEGARKVSEDNAKADELHQKREDYLLGLKESALKGEIAQLMEQGKFKKALTQSALLEELSATQKRITDARAGAQRLKEIEEQNKGKTAVAGIRASAARDVAAAKVNDLMERYKLDASVRKSMLSLASRFLSGAQMQKDAAGEPIYDNDTMHDMLDKLVDMAEEHSPLFQETPTGVKPAPGTTPPKAAGATGGPAANPDVAAAFAKRRAARAAAQK